ncbi:hypothetical protein J2T17_004432 [Paenibacillus mucilaginosus]|uniref:hypothetical protein n=1 Tax=Paenibacillus mucilaginosus TaxID=61624 RepID=UPI003D2139E7
MEPLANTREEIVTNYHSFLWEIKDVFDPVLLQMRNQDPETWRWQAWLGPLLKYKGAFRAAGALGKISWGSLPFISTGAVVGGVTYSPLPVWVSIVMAVLLVLLVYWILVMMHISNMATVGHPDFHIGALKEKKPHEYRLWSPFFQKHNATFSGLFHFTSQLLQPNSTGSIQTILDYTRGQTDAANTEKEGFRAERDFLIEELERNEKAIGYLVDVIRGTNKSLYRMVNGNMNFHELDFVCPYTIYEVKDSVLVKKMDRGTSGRSPDKIPLNEKNADKYAAVDVVLRPNETGVSYMYPYPGRIIIAYRMKMNHDKEWVWSFHMDDTDEKALSLTLSNDIIEIREVYRLIHAFCLVLQKSMSEKEEEAI